MLDSLTCIFVILGVIPLSIYVGKHAVRQGVRKLILRVKIGTVECQFDDGFNDALRLIESQLVTRKWVKPMVKRGKI